MKVLLLTKMFPRVGNDNFGSYVYEQARELKKLGIELVIVSPQVYIPKIFGVCGGKIRKYAYAPNEYSYKEFHIYSPKCIWAKELLNKNINLKYWIFKQSVYKYVVSICQQFQPDIIYGLDPLMDGRLCVEIGEDLKIPVVLIEHSVPQNYRNFIDNEVAKQIYKKVCECASRVIFVTKRQKNLFFDLLGLRCQYDIVLNGYRNENISTRVTPHKIEDQVLKLVSIGFLEDRKGYMVLFNALQEMLKRNVLDFQLTVIGDGCEKERYGNIVERYGLSSKVVFKGIIPHTEVFEILNQSDIFVLPSYEEAFGIAYLEAMSCGLPVIGTEDEGISDIIINGENGYLIPKKDANKLADLLIKIKENPAEAEKVASNGLKDVKKYGWDRNAEEVYRVFRYIISGK